MQDRNTLKQYLRTFPQASSWSTVRVWRWPCLWRVLLPLHALLGLLIHLLLGRQRVLRLKRNHRSWWSWHHLLLLSHWDSGHRLLLQSKRRWRYFFWEMSTMWTNPVLTRSTNQTQVIGPSALMCSMPYLVTIFTHNHFELEHWSHMLLWVLHPPAWLESLQKFVQLGILHPCHQSTELLLFPGSS